MSGIRAQWRENCNTIFLLMKQSGLSLIYTGTLGVWHANIHPGTRVPMLKACLSIYTFCQHFSPSTYPSTLATSENFLQAAKKRSYCQISLFLQSNPWKSFPFPHLPLREFNYLSRGLKGQTDTLAKSTKTRQELVCVTDRYDSCYLPAEATRDDGKSERRLF